MSCTPLTVSGPINPPLLSTPTGDTSSFSNVRYTLSSSGMSNSTSSNISNSQLKKSQSWRTLVININSAPGKRAELENLINYTDPDLIIMTETKIDEQVKASEFLPKAILEILGKIGVREVVEL